MKHSHPLDAKQSFSCKYNYCTNCDLEWLMYIFRKSLSSPPPPKIWYMMCNKVKNKHLNNRSNSNFYIHIRGMMRFLLLKIWDRKGRWGNGTRCFLLDTRLEATSQRVTAHKHTVLETDVNLHASHMGVVARMVTNGILLTWQGR